ncbi:MULTISPECIES: helix-turn-helix domain-containing protein [unclassified Halomonas]|uniref:winged helix-turn-helix domain-containing protein n=1 Tax=unclassified Halomonas TaxID=2609666 RepID=UPI00209E5993|nr:MULTISPECIES: winged helix-turn-helix domain-containing protein [unclassified Halomonas]MCP1316049.1 winged helix-turn-helix domain-containing protein [Halomonas sp. 707D7]MCP1325728.1 winged helix-turn-helix domain-containing protein [Halomonas sp. 707D4]
MTDALSKTRSSFYRRLYVAYLIDHGIHSVPDLMTATGMPRRTAQDTIASLGELDIDCVFEPTQGERHNSGRYVIKAWGAIDPAWVAANAERLGTALGYR